MKLPMKKANRKALLVSTEKVRELTTEDLKRAAGALPCAGTRTKTINCIATTDD